MAAITGKIVAQLLEAALKTGDDITIKAVRALVDDAGEVATKEGLERVGLGPVSKVGSQKKALELLENISPTPADTKTPLLKSGDELKGGLFSISPTGRSGSPDPKVTGILSPSMPALQVAGLFGRGHGADLLRATDELAADTGTQVERAVTGLLPEGLLRANADVQLGRAVQVPGANITGRQQGFFRRLEGLTAENRKLVGQGVRLALDEDILKLGRVSEARRAELTRGQQKLIDRIERENLTEIVDSALPGQSERTGQVIASTSQELGFENLMNNIFRRLETGADPTVRQTGGMVPKKRQSGGPADPIDAGIKLASGFSGDELGNMAQASQFRNLGRPDSATHALTSQLIAERFGIPISQALGVGRELFSGGLQLAQGNPFFSKAGFDTQDIISNQIGLSQANTPGNVFVDAIMELFNSGAVPERQTGGPVPQDIRIPATEFLPTFQTGGFAGIRDFGIPRPRPVTPGTGGGGGTGSPLSFGGGLVGGVGPATPGGGGGAGGPAGGLVGQIQNTASNVKANTGQLNAAATGLQNFNPFAGNTGQAAEGTLGNLLGGAPVDVSGITDVAQSRAERTFNDLIAPSVNEEFGALGLGSSSAKTAELARQAGNLAATVGETGVLAGVDEAQAQRMRQLNALGSFQGFTGQQLNAQGNAGSLFGQSAGLGLEASLGGLSGLNRLASGLIPIQAQAQFNAQTGGMVPEMNTGGRVDFADFLSNLLFGVTFNKPEQAAEPNPIAFRPGAGSRLSSSPVRLAPPVSPSKQAQRNAQGGLPLNIQSLIDADARSRADAQDRGRAETFARNLLVTSGDAFRNPFATVEQNARLAGSTGFNNTLSGLRQTGQLFGQAGSAVANAASRNPFIPTGQTGGKTGELEPRMAEPGVIDGPAVPPDTVPLLASGGEGIIPQDVMGMLKNVSTPEQAMQIVTTLQDIMGFIPGDRGPEAGDNGRQTGGAAIPTDLGNAFLRSLPLNTGVAVGDTFAQRGDNATAVSPLASATSGNISEVQDGSGGFFSSGIGQEEAEEQRLTSEIQEARARFDFMQSLALRDGNRNTRLRAELLPQAAAELQAAEAALQASRASRAELLRAEGTAAQGRGQELSGQAQVDRVGQIPLETVGSVLQQGVAAGDDVRSALETLAPFLNDEQRAALEANLPQEQPNPIGSFVDQLGTGERNLAEINQLPDEAKQAIMQEILRRELMGDPGFPPGTFNRLQTLGDQGILDRLNPFN